MDVIGSLEYPLRQGRREYNDIYIYIYIYITKNQQSIHFPILYNYIEI